MYKYLAKADVCSSQYLERDPVTLLMHYSGDNKELSRLPVEHINKQVDEHINKQVKNKIKNKIK